MARSPQENLIHFSLFFIPLIVISKIIRWTILWRVLVQKSIGRRMLRNMASGYYNPFHSILSNLDEGGSSGIAQSNAEALFSSINIFGFTDYVEWEIFFTIVFNLIIFLLVRKFYLTTPNVTWKQNLLIYMAFSILNIFCLNMSKEPYQLIFFCLMGWGISYFKGYQKKSYWILFTIALTILYARKYYVLVFVFYIATQVFVKKFFDGLDTHSKSGKKLLVVRLIYMFLILAAFHFVLFQFISGANAEAYEDLISVNDRSQDRSSVAVSEIVPWFGSSNQFFVTMEFFAKIFRLSCPIELLVIGKFTYVLIIVFQLLLAYSLVRAFSDRTTGAESRNGFIEYEEEVEDEDETGEAIESDEEEEPDVVVADEEQDDEEEVEVATVYEESEDRKETRTAALYLYIAFLLCSACFEPDFGSWTRHLGVAFPVILFIL